LQVLKGGDGNTALYLTQPMENGDKMIIKGTTYVAGGGWEFGPVEETCRILF